MKKIKSIQLKAAFLLIAFSLNTIIGFACAAGLGMDLNSQYHEKVTKAIVHADGKKHYHDNGASDDHKGNDKENCCNDQITKIAQQDKAIASSINITIPNFFSAFIAGIYNNDALLSARIDSFNKHYVRSHHPPIPDIRIAIQSFQI